MEAKKKCDNIEMDEKGEPIEPIEPTANNEIYFMAPFWDDTVLALSLIHIFFNNLTISISGILGLSLIHIYVAYPGFLKLRKFGIFVVYRFKIVYL